MVLTETINLTPDTLRERLDQWQERRRARLLQETSVLQLHAEPDAISGGWAVRSPHHRGYVEIVTDDGCTCPEYAAMGSCPHAAVVAALQEAGAA